MININWFFFIKCCFVQKLSISCVFSKYYGKTWHHHHKMWIFCEDKLWISALGERKRYLHLILWVDILMLIYHSWQNVSTFCNSRPEIGGIGTSSNSLYVFVSIYSTKFSLEIFSYFIWHKYSYEYFFFHYFICSH